MSYDLSRVTFNSLDDYFGVVMQQGRVQLDADWNELIAQIGRRLRAGSLDTFGPAVVPRVTPDGFLVSGPANAIEIGPGRIYVDGLLAENHTDTLKWDPRLEELSGTARLSGADIDAAPTGPAGTTPYDAQPYYPTPPALPDGEPYLVYVDVWQRDVTYLQDRELVDVAVGVDTTARRQTVWQVKFLDGVGAIDAATADVDIPGWLEAVHPSSARLSTATGDLTDDDNPCLLPPQAGYKGLENQLYRVQVHDGGPVGTATYKWSRDNAVVASRVSAILAGDEIVVESLGRDDVLEFHEGEWVEIIDDHCDFHGLPGELRRIRLGDGIDRATRTIRLEGAALPTGSNPGEFEIDGDGNTTESRNTRIIRWDQSGIVFREDESQHTDLDAGGSSGVIEIPPAGTRLFLEKGILVDFDIEDVVDQADFDPVFKTGDYWVFAARVNDGTIEELDRAPPDGIHHHYAKIAIVDASGITDCRRLWPPEAGGESCACTVCVHPDTHNNGTATIQQAIDEVNAAGGGTICLSVGEYQIGAPIRLAGSSVTLRGQGWETRLINREEGPVIAIGGESTSMNLALEQVFIVSSVARGFGAAVTVTNVLGLNIRECFIANLAAADGTSQGLQFTGVAGLAAVTDCQILAEHGIVGPRLQDEFLATLDFRIEGCSIAGSIFGIGFRELSFHIGELRLAGNHLSAARDVGIELGGAGGDDTRIDIDANLFTNCRNGIRSGLSNIRINGNDLEVDRGDDADGNAITLIDGLDPDPADGLQIIGNRIRNHGGHGIAVQSAVGKLMIKQNQIEEIGGAAFVIEAGGSVDYLSFENNQLRNIAGNIAGALPGVDDLFVGVFLQATRGADITNNVIDGVVRTSPAARFRSGIGVTSSGEVRITGNNLMSVTPPSYSGTGAGIAIAGTVGSFEVNDNRISRVPDESDDEEFGAAIWKPLIVETGGIKRPGATVRPGVAVVASMIDSAPVIGVSNAAYALSPRNLVNIGRLALARNNVTVRGNVLDSTTSSTDGVNVNVPMYCGFIDNEVRSETPGFLVDLTADHIAANNNRLMTTDDRDILRLECRRFVLMGNMTTGNIAIVEDGTIGRPSEPWKSLNIII